MVEWLWCNIRGRANDGGAQTACEAGCADIMRVAGQGLGSVLTPRCRGMNGRVQATALSFVVVAQCPTFRLCHQRRLVVRRL